MTSVIEPDANIIKWPMSKLISHITQIMTLLPGDIILTGTPGGYCGLMEPGHQVEIEIEGIGILQNALTASNV